MFLLFWKLICWLCVFVSFSNPAVVINENIYNEAIVNPFYTNVLFDNDIVDYINNVLLLDQISPEMNYNMGRYVDDSFKTKCGFFKYNYIDYGSFLHDYVLKLGQYSLTSYSEKNAHLLVFVSTLKKMYILNYAELDSLDYYIMEWAKNNLSLTEIEDYRNLVLDSPRSIRLIVYRPEIDVISLIK